MEISYTLPLKNESINKWKHIKGEPLLFNKGDV
jgi:hypothetical protein